MNMYAKGSVEKKAVEGFCLEKDFLKTRDWQHPGYLNQVKRKEFKDQDPELPERFGYIFAKSGQLLSCGPYIYARRDFFNFPDPVWNLPGIVNCAEQLVHRLRGISENYPVQVDSIRTAIEFMETMHFKSGEIETISERSHFLFTGNHMVTDESAQLFFNIMRSDSIG
jgi:hypothetical protein